MATKYEIARPSLRNIGGQLATLAYGTLGIDGTPNRWSRFAATLHANLAHKKNQNPI
jgi:hypothetical protein